MRQRQQSSYKDGSYLDEIALHREKLLMVNEELVNRYPHLLIGALICQDKDGRMVMASGALVSPNLVVTAAHAIFNRRQGFGFPNYGDQKKMESTSCFTLQLKNSSLNKMVIKLKVGVIPINIPNYRTSNQNYMTML